MPNDYAAWYGAIVATWALVASWKIEKRRRRGEQAQEIKNLKNDARDLLQAFQKLIRSYERLAEKKEMVQAFKDRVESFGDRIANWKLYTKEKEECSIVPQGIAFVNSLDDSFLHSQSRSPPRDIDKLIERYRVNLIRFHETCDKKLKKLL
jgi:hypothetical protein